MISFWERESFTRYDYAIIGSGIVGLSAAISVKENEPHSRVMVLERGLFPTGASTKNAGFACIGSPTELLADLKTMPEQEVCNLVALRHKGLLLLRNRLGDAAIDYQSNGSYEILGPDELYCINHLPQLNQLLEPVVQGTAFGLAPNGLASSFGFNPGFAKAMVVNRFEGQLDTGKMMQALLQLAVKMGITVLNGAEVTAFTDAGNRVELLVNHPFMKTDVVFKARKMAVCTNAFARQLLPDIDLQPGRGQVLVTQPVQNLLFKGIFHFNEGFYYFRNFENRVIFGGGRNLNFKAETTTNLSTTSEIMNDLLFKLKTCILPHANFTIDTTWAGIMAFGAKKTPLLKLHSPNVVVGVKLSGMGVAIGSMLGKQVYELLCQ
ncbi:FAD-binding oxidoreductase [Sphingobacteriales bacterium UPWRP_1]|nr:FAD-dependent oxidoreductase [Sphingobacteriales bacterium TSM_CSM]PSJ78209.1 FAD-binding oxidoreductase [Sphingobacteriales bacterium UPWRP_1]